ncbi:unnamed protein product [Effrenium voratum]|uniref:Uncharacterized protein n=1 Tax=Effrenium voratum TaxID=2562239 RepID=A0AA36MR07_9DINO|nr:unnamed protein product [Effrenium voratum]
MDSVRRARSPAAVFRKAVRILFSLRDSTALQLAAFKRLWSRFCNAEDEAQASRIETILAGHSAISPEVFAVEACRAFCVLQLQHSLQKASSLQGIVGNQHWAQAEQWLLQAVSHEHSWYVELVLRYTFSHACEPSDAGLGHYPDFNPRLNMDWGVPPLQQGVPGGVRANLILQHLRLWQRVDEATRRHSDGLPETILMPLDVTLKSLQSQVMNQELTVQRLLSLASLDKWASPGLVELLGRFGPPAELEPTLKRVVADVGFMLQFERACTDYLPALADSLGQFAGELRRQFVKDSCQTAARGEFQQSVSELAVCVAQLDPAAWDKDLGLGADPVCYRILAAAIETLHLAKYGNHRPLQSMFEECSAGQQKNNGLELVLTWYHKFMGVLQQFIQLGSKEAGLPAKLLCAIEKHWHGVAPQSVPRILNDLQRVNPDLSGNFSVVGDGFVGDRLGQVLKGRQTAEFWDSLGKVLAFLCGDEVERGFSEATCRQEKSLQALHAALKTPDTQEALSVEDLENVGTATERTLSLFTFLDAGSAGSGLDQVRRLVSSMADVPGLTFLKVLLDSAGRGQNLATRLAELVEGALTQETLASVEMSSAMFMPFCVGILSAMRIDVDPRKFSAAVGGSWSADLQAHALHARSQNDVAELLLSMLRESSEIMGHRFSDVIDSLRSALRQGQVIQQKIEENSDDATAVSNTVHGMVSSGYLKLALSSDTMRFEVNGAFVFERDQVKVTETRDMQQLTECSDKAGLAVPKGEADNSTALTREKVQIFTGCVEGMIGLRQQLTELLQLGHPCVWEAGELKFPQEEEGLSASTLQELNDWLKWAQDAVQQWRAALDTVRARCAIMSCIPARNVMKVADAILKQDTGTMSRLMSLDVDHRLSYLELDALTDLEGLFTACQRLSAGEGVQAEFLDTLAELLRQVVPEACLDSFSPLHDVAKQYPRKRVPEDNTMKSRVQRRGEPKLSPRRVLLIQEEQSHEAGSPSLQSTAAITVLSVLFQLGVGPRPDNVLLCDASTTTDEVSRFLHRATHLACTRAPDQHTKALCVFVHVDCLQLDVLQALLSRVDALQAAVGKRQATGGAHVGIEVPLVFTVTRHAPQLMIDSLAKDICQQQQIRILTLQCIKRELQDADKAKALGLHSVVTSDFAGDGKTHAICNHERWHKDSHAILVWGGAQTRGQAARALRDVGNRSSVRLELHSFEEGGGVDADMLLMELLLFRSVFDPETSEWVRLLSGTALFIEVANSIKFKQHASEALMLLSAPILKCMPGNLKIDADTPFCFVADDLHPETAQETALAFGLAGEALLLNYEQRRLVGAREDEGVVSKRSGCFLPPC